MLKSFWFWMVFLFVAVQFIPIDTPTDIESPKEDELQADEAVLSILKRSCYDCHSNHVELPYYDKIAPASVFAMNHVKKGRKALNFSQWNNYTKEKQLKILEKIPKSIVIRMPLPSYLWLHKSATLTQKEKKILKRWSQKLKENIN